MILLFTGFCTQARGLGKLGGFLSFNLGLSVDTRLTEFNYPLFISYGGNILQDQYVGAFNIGLSGYRAARMPLLFGYSYDFDSSSNLSYGVDTYFSLGGSEEGGGININIGHDIGLFLRRRITDGGFHALLRIGLSNGLIITTSRERYTLSNERRRPDEEGWLSPHLYLTVGMQWYL